MPSHLAIAQGFRKLSRLFLNKKSYLNDLSQQKILIDGVIFQLQEKSGGISVVWANYFKCLSKSSLADKVVILDRNETAPRFDKLNYRTIKKYRGKSSALRKRDAIYLEKICRRESASLFISTYYTFAEETKTVIMLHDFIPERLGWDLNTSQWQAKSEAIDKAQAFICISQNTCEDFQHFYPQFIGKEAVIIPHGVSEIFHPHSEEEIRLFLERYDIKKPFYLVVGHRWSHKNIILLLKAIQELPETGDFELIFAGGADKMEKEYLPYLKNVRYRILHLSEEDLSLSYAAALALVYPSLYEGFGLPLLEAMRSSCPVITSPNSSLLEIGKGACLYVEEDDVPGMSQALRSVRDPNIREKMIEAGRRVSAQYCWGESFNKLFRYINRQFGPSHAFIDEASS